MHSWSGEAFKGTVVNRTCQSIQGEPLELSFLQNTGQRFENAFLKLFSKSFF